MMFSPVTLRRGHSLRNLFVEKKRYSTTKYIVKEPSQDVDERPTPLLFCPWGMKDNEILPKGWSNLMDIMSLKGFTCSSIVLSPTYSLKDETIDHMVNNLHQAATGLCIPPIILATSIGSFIAQKYLESYPAAGLILLSPLPPNPEKYMKRNPLFQEKNHGNLLKELMDPRNQVNLEKNAVPTLILGHTKQEQEQEQEEQELKEIADFHGVCLENDFIQVSSSLSSSSKQQGLLLKDKYGKTVEEIILEWIDLRY